VSRRLAGALVLGLSLAAPGLAHAEPSAAERYVAMKQSTFGVLGAWGLGSMGAGGALAFGGRTDFEKGLGIQNLVWGAVETAFAVAGEAQARRGLFVGPDAKPWQADRASLAKAFWANAALDVAFVLAGALIWNLGGTDLVRGTGAGIALQGGFVFCFDTLGYMRFR
jgi:hypothetical protein